MEALEEWREIPGLEGRYWVSSWGRAKSARKILKPVYDGRYYRICYQDSDTKKHTYIRVHVAMGKAFLDLQDGQVVRHLNDVSTDNYLSNLAVGTRSDNHHDMVRNGVHGMARKTHCVNDHEFTPENTRYYGPDNRYRRCLACKLGKK